MVNDVEVEDHGSIVLFTMMTADATRWWAENVQEGMTWGGSQVVEHRYADDIIAGMQDDGLVVVIDETGEANARLIAAAPDLLAAAKDALGWLEHGSMPDKVSMKARTNSYHALRAAIAKAEQ